MAAEVDETLQQQARDVLRQRAESLARETLEEATDETVTLLQFRTGPEWYAISIADVREIVADFVVTPLPCVPRFVAGVLNLRGEIISVSDAGLLMEASPGAARTSAVDGVGGGPDDRPAPAIVVAEGDVATALLVDEVGDIVDVRTQDLEPPVITGGRAQSEFVWAVTEIEGRLVAAVRTQRVLEPVVTGLRH